MGDAAPSQLLSITNNVPADGFSESLDAAIGLATGGVTASGNITLLAAGATDNTSLSVGINTATAGSKNGTATIALSSDGTGTSGLGATALAPQIVNVTGAVYRYASSSAHSPEPVVLANQHVGDNLTQVLTLANTAIADGFSEGLDAAFSGTSGAATASGSFGNLVAGGTNSSSLLVGLNTATAGAKNGTATIALTSNGTSTSGLGLTALTAQTVNVSGNVYRLASASAHTPEPVNFGVVHVGDVTSQALTLTNTAANDGFSEKLNASFSGVTGDATAVGTFLLLNAQATNNSSLSVGVNTATAGNKAGTATIALASDGAGTSGLGTTNLTSQTVNVQAQVNFYAEPELFYKAGTATLTQMDATHYVLDFGSVTQNSGSYLGSFGILNFANSLTFQDSLGGSFDTALVTNFGLAGFNPFTGIASGGAFDPDVTFNSAMAEGLYTNVLYFNPTSTNASGTSNLAAIRLDLVATVAVIPEPMTAMLTIFGLGALALRRRRRA